MSAFAVTRLALRICLLGLLLGRATAALAEPMVMGVTGPTQPVCPCAEVCVWVWARDVDQCCVVTVCDIIDLAAQADGWTTDGVHVDLTGCYYQTFKKTFTSAGSATVTGTATDRDVCQSEKDGTLTKSLTVTAVDKWQAAPAIAFDGIESPVSGTSVRAGAEVTCTAATATDNDSKNCAPELVADQCTYTWSLSGGTFKNGVNTGQTVTWIAPSTPGTRHITVTVQDMNNANKPSADCGTRDDAPASAYVDVLVDTVNPEPGFGSGGGFSPSVTIGSNTYVPSDFTITVNASDNVAVGSVTCTPPGETREYPDCEQTNVTAIFDVVDHPDGQVTISATAHDCAGNQATTTKDVIVDGTAPTSAVQALPESVSTTSFVVSWSGQDNTGGVGLKDYDVQCRDGSGAWTGWLSATTQTSATFTGQIGHTYYFQCRARDKLDNLESYPGGDGDTHTTVGCIVEVTASPACFVPGHPNAIRYRIHPDGCTAGYGKLEILPRDSSGQPIGPAVYSATDLALTGGVEHTYTYSGTEISADPGAYLVRISVGPSPAILFADQASFDVRVWDLATFFLDSLTDEEKAQIDAENGQVDPDFVAAWDPLAIGDTTLPAYCAGVDASTVTPDTITITSWCWDDSESESTACPTSPGIETSSLSEMEWVYDWGMTVEEKPFYDERGTALMPIAGPFYSMSDSDQWYWLRIQVADGGALDTLGLEFDGDVDTPAREAIVKYRMRIDGDGNITILERCCE